MATSKSALFSSIFISSLLMFIIGLEPFIPEIIGILPPEWRSILMIVLPGIIMVARRYNENGPIKLFKFRKNEARSNDNLDNTVEENSRYLDYSRFVDDVIIENKPSTND